jgi:hypothetical protein
LTEGQVVHAAAVAGRFTAEAERAFNAFLASRAGEAAFTAGLFPSPQSLSLPTEVLLERGCGTLNENERRIREGLLVNAGLIEVNEPLYAVYRQVGPKQMLERRARAAARHHRQRAVVSRRGRRDLEGSRSPRRGDAEEKLKPARRRKGDRQLMCAGLLAPRLSPFTCEERAALPLGHALLLPRLQRAALRGVRLDAHLGRKGVRVQRALQTAEALPATAHSLVEAVVVVMAVQVPMRFHARTLRPCFGVDALWQLSRTRLELHLSSASQTDVESQRINLSPRVPSRMLRTECC